MTLAVVRSLNAPKRLTTAQELEDFEQELVDQYLLAGVGAGLTDGVVAEDRRVLFAFAQHLGRPLWEAGVEDADQFLGVQRARGLARSTIYGKAVSLAQFYDFLIVRYQGDIHHLTGFVVAQPIDEFNRPPKAEYGAPRIPPSSAEVDKLFTEWRESLPMARKYLPAARGYLAASLWRRVGLRINETSMLDIRDWRPDLGSGGKIHVRFGKGSRRRGPKARLVSAIDQTDALIEWWLTDVRHQFGDDWNDPDAPLLPSERHDPLTGRCQRASTDVLGRGLTIATERYLPSWTGRLTPHVLRHYCASSLYERGMDIKALQELLGHEWLSTTTRYIHVHDDHVEHAWTLANQRVAARLGEKE